MKQIRTALIAIIVATLFAAAGCSQSRPGAYTIKSSGSFVLPLYQGTKVNAIMFTPVTDNPNETFPSIIMISSWSMSEYEYYVQGKRFAEEGYNVLMYDPRGWLDGELEIASDKDVNDLKTAIDWLLKNAKVKMGADGKPVLAAGGISYGSVICGLTASQDDRIKVLFALSSMGDARRAMFDQDTAHQLMMWLLVKTGEWKGRLSKEVKDKMDDAFNNRNIEEQRAWLSKRSPMNYLETFNKKNIPVYLSINMFDELFWGNSIVDFFSRLTVPKRLDMNLGDHAQSESLGLLGFYEGSQPWNATLEWLDYWLKGKDNGVLKKPKVTMVVARSKVREEFENWPSARVSTQSLYLAPRPRESFAYGELVEKPIDSPQVPFNTINSGKISGISAGLPLVSYPLMGHTPIQVRTWLPGVRDSRSIVYTTPSLARPMKIRGVPRLNVWIEPSRPQAQIIAHLFDVNSAGIATLITHGPATLHSAKPNEPVQLSLELCIISYDVPIGHRLALAIDTYDPLYNPPTSEPYRIKFVYGKNHQSNIVVPIMK
ncbi:MAG TPA: CocE/NonD family hydrolase [Spirochaetota bacterium]|nr:CocE/NonD family hydrolase [Spirochaetota bacterium]HPU90368.1 CocE/NonD family hydrolase [Spirochaetota bacterium]